MKVKMCFIILLCVFNATISTGQKPNKKFQVSGLATDFQQKPVVGAFILVDGKNTNIVTDNRGYYKVRVRPDADSITLFTFNTGISTVAIEGKTIVNFTLGGNGSSVQKGFTDTAGDEKVNIGYGEVNKKSLLTPVNTIDASDHKYAAYKNIYEILQGIPGVMVNGNSIKIQGVSSFNSGTEPLYVIDGMVVDNVDGISPSMVENISVLKGASTSIYGSRGANGVILITLINGSKKSK